MSRRRIGLYGSGEVPRSRRWASRSVGPKSNGLRDLGALPPVRRIRPTRLMTKAVAAAAISPLATVVAIVATMLLATSAVPQTSMGAEPYQTPPPPYNVAGFVYDAAGNPATGINLVITNLNTSQSTTTVSDSGAYIVDLNPISGGVQPPPGTRIMVEASLGPEFGNNITTVPTPPGGLLWMDVRLGVVIPEFKDVALPIVGMVVMFAIVAAVARSKKDE